MLRSLTIWLLMAAPAFAQPVPHCGVGPWSMCQYLDHAGEPLTDAIFQRAQAFSEDLAAVQIGGLWGYVDRGGRVVLAPTYQQASPFRHGLAEVETEVGIALITTKGKAIAIPQVRRAVPVSDDVIMTWSDDPGAAQAYPTAELSRDLSHRPEQEIVFVYTTARLYSLTKGWINTPPLRRIALISGAHDTFWFQIAESGPTWDFYDWGMMRADGSWVIPPSIMDIFVLPDGLTLAFDPPAGKRMAHDSNFGWELDANTLGFESVIDADGQAVGPMPEDTGATKDGRPLVKQGWVWFLLSDGVLVHYDGEPERFSFRGPSIGDRRFDTFNVASTCEGGLIHFSEPQSATTVEEARALLWGLKDSRGRVQVPAIYPVITCPEHGVAMVPDTHLRRWCPVGRGPQAEWPSNCRRELWDGIIREDNGQIDKPRDPDPFRASILVWQDKLLRQVYPGLDFGKPED